MRNSRASIVFIVVFALCVSCNMSINRSIHIEDGRSVGGFNTINGSITIGEECRVGGSCRSVNGIIEVGRLSRIRDVQTVNGRILIENEAVVRGDIESVNGSVGCRRGVEISGEINTVNGDIDLENTTVARDLTTYTGDVLLESRSIIRGDIIVKKSNSRSRRRRTLHIEITDNSVVHGNIIVRDYDIEAVVILSHGGRVEGRVRNAEVVER